MDDHFKYSDIDKSEWLEDISMEIAHRLLLRFVQRSVLVKEKVGSLKRDLPDRVSIDPVLF